jgi:hypothetical protein
MTSVYLAALLACGGPFGTYHVRPLLGQVERRTDPDIPEPRIRGVCMIVSGKGCSRQVPVVALSSP